MDSSPDKRNAKPRHFHSIHVHEDAIILSPSRPSASELEEALHDLSLGSRKPLGELDIQRVHSEHVARHGTSDSASGNLEQAAPSYPSSSTSFLPMSADVTANSQDNFIPSSTNRENCICEKGHTAPTQILPTAKATSQALLTGACESPGLADRHGVALTPQQEHTKAIIETSGFQQEKGVHHQKRTTSTSKPYTVTPIKRSLKSLAAMATPASRRTVSNKENWTPSRDFGTPIRATYDALEAAVVDAATPPASLSRPRSSGQPNTPSEVAAQVAAQAVDLDTESSKASRQPSQKVDHETQPSIVDASEQGETLTAEPTQTVHIESERSMPARDDSPASVVYKPAESRASTPGLREQTATKAVGTTTKSTPLVRTTKAAQARIQLAHGPKPTQTAAWGPPRQSLSGHERTSSVRQSMLISSRKASDGSVSTASSDDEKKEPVIPHSKPRPMSMIFPAPPPPPKGRAPTKSTFVLPGEIFAAKLKAAREEREQKDDSVKAFKARPMPASIKQAPVVRQTNTSRARESIGGRDSILRVQGVDSAHRRASSVAAVRLSENKPPVRPTSGDKPFAATSLKAADCDGPPATSLANISKPRDASPALAMVAPSTGMSKGREVYSREIFANAAAEREKRAKEEALRKARADAAERSRQLSREWAEKKRREATAAKAQVKA